MTELRIEYMGLDDLVPDERNPKGHRLDLIDNSYSEFGYVESVVMDERTGKLLAGHGRLEQLQARRRDGKPAPDGIEVRPDGTWAVPVTRGTATKDDAHAAAFLVAANKLTEAGGWRDDALSELLHGLPDLPMLELTGFTLPELADLDESLAHPYGAHSDPDAVPDVPEVPVSKRGDVWDCGKHRVMCGDATMSADVERLMGGKLANLVVTDPPYGVRYTGGQDKKYQRDALENDTIDVFADSLPLAFLASESDAALYLWFAGSLGHLAFDATRRSGYEVRALIVWHKLNAHFGAFMSQYMPKHEPMLYCYKSGQSPKWRGPTNEVTVWEYEQPAKNAWHPTQKPVALMARAIQNSSDRTDTVLDLFGGSGSTLIACCQEGRVARLMEIDPAYVDVICRRYQEHTGDVPVHESTGQPHDFIQPEGQ